MIRIQGGIYFINPLEVRASLKKEKEKEKHFIILFFL